jgi:hypothetical protein
MLCDEELDDGMPASSYGRFGAGWLNGWNRKQSQSVVPRGTSAVPQQAPTSSRAAGDAHTRDVAGDSNPQDSQGVRQRR